MAAMASRRSTCLLLLLVAPPLCAPWLSAARGHRAAAVRMAVKRGPNKFARREQLVKDMDQQARRREPDGPWEEDPSTPLALACVRAGDARKARDVSALRVGHLTSAANFFVNMVGGSKAQIEAIVKTVEDDAAENFARVGKRQGKATSGWVCLDFDDVVVNIFSEQQRDFYQLDKFWGAAEFIDLTEILIPNLAPAGEERAEGDVDEWLLGDDDDWSLGAAHPHRPSAAPGLHRTSGWQPWDVRSSLSLTCLTRSRSVPGQTTTTGRCRRCPSSRR